MDILLSGLATLGLLGQFLLEHIVKRTRYQKPIGLAVLILTVTSVWGSYYVQKREAHALSKGFSRLSEPIKEAKISYSASLLLSSHPSLKGYQSRLDALCVNVAADITEAGPTIYVPKDNATLPVAAVSKTRDGTLSLSYKPIHGAYPDKEQEKLAFYALTTFRFWMYFLKEVKEPVIVIQPFGPFGQKVDLKILVGAFVDIPEKGPYEGGPSKSYWKDTMNLIYDCSKHVIDVYIEPTEISSRYVDGNGTIVSKGDLLGSRLFVQYHQSMNFEPSTVKDFADTAFLHKVMQDFTLNYISFKFPGRRPIIIRDKDLVIHREGVPIEDAPLLEYKFPKTEAEFDSKFGR